MRTFEEVEITNDVAENLLSVAITQLGYNESTLNYEYDANAEKNGYTRYGEWYGNPYGKWNTVFVSFCINYANINEADKLISASPEVMRLAWQEKKVYTAADKYSCLPGDVVFFDTDSDGKADRTGIATYSTENKLMVIEGDVNGAVDRVVYEDEDIASVMGYGMTGELYAAEYIEETASTQPEIETQETTEVSGELNFYIPDEETSGEETVTMQNVFDSDPLALMSNSTQAGITYTSHLEGEVIDVVIKDINLSLIHI